ncbi:hypothetical protein Y695_03329 [Hydrogenophaga sp. T4]|nr:hypothetical protein Y695_03329 [Hydrogenophaga sp. T4]
MSDFSALSELSRAVIRAMTRKMLNSSLAATKLAPKMLPTASRGLPVQAKTTRKVATMEGTSTLARNIMVTMMQTTPIRYIQCAAVRVTVESMSNILWG